MALRRFFDPRAFSCAGSEEMFRPNLDNSPEQPRSEQSGGRPALPSYHHLPGAPEGSSGDPIEDLFSPDDEMPLDEFDRRLLSQQHDYPSLGSDHPPARISLPPTSLQQPFHGSATRWLRNDLRKTPVTSPAFSSSPGQPVSSPTVSALQQRVTQIKRHGKNQSQQQYEYPNKPQAQPIKLDHAAPTVQGIHLVPVTELPDLYRTVFPYSIFNAVQSKCFPIAFHTSDNLVLSAPTGCGKTMVMELAICHLLSNHRDQDFKVVYQAPTKALCAERYRDWHKKFGPLDLECAELTGDTELGQLRSVQRARIIITTPEKWDSVTRKWKDNARLMGLVKLFLIDEVHILKESRGATLEAVVSRMKSVGSNVRFVALSATIPNSNDIATWLGKNTETLNEAAHCEVFGEEFRPVQLQKIVQGFPFAGNEWALDSMLSARVPEVIAQHSTRKPVMIFCVSRNSAVNMAHKLAELWQATSSACNLWNGPKSAIRVTDPDLKNTVSAGVAYHHGGLTLEDRNAVEQGFLNGNIMIICSTSTLAVGVNLPCFLVIIKGTMGWTDVGLKDYSDLELMQMLGRAGRPQFESSARAVILTRDQKTCKYENMVSGRELLESCLHLNLVDHLNAEIGLGTIYDLPSAQRWLEGSFLFVRLRSNPTFYKLEQSVEGDIALDADSLIGRICQNDIKLLQGAGLVTNASRFHITELGDAMARYCVKFETMKTILALPPKAKVSEVLSVLAQAVEFKDVRLRAGEKSFYKQLNGEPNIKFPIKVDISQLSHKVSLIVQAELGACLLPSAEPLKKHRTSYQMDKTAVFSHVSRLIRCIIDCQLFLEDSVSARSALQLARSLGARVWDQSCLEMKQIEGIGDVGTRKLASAGINSIESLESADAHCIEMILGRNPPFGNRLIKSATEFPKLRIQVKRMDQKLRPGKGVEIRCKASVAFMNAKPPQYFRRRPIYVCFLAETSFGRLVDFRRMSSTKLQNPLDILVSALLVRPTAFIRCYVMCDEIAGTSKEADLQLDNFPSSTFPPAADVSRTDICSASTGVNTSGPGIEGEQDFDDAVVADADMIVIATKNAKMEVVQDIDELMANEEEVVKTNKELKKRTASNPSSQKDVNEQGSAWKEPVQLANGRWTCQHSCRVEGKQCSHKCCEEGVAKPKRPTGKSTSATVSGGAKCVSSYHANKKQKIDESQLKIKTTMKSTRDDRTSSGPVESESTARLSLNSALKAPGDLAASQKAIESYCHPLRRALSFNKGGLGGNASTAKETGRQDPVLDKIPDSGRSNRKDSHTFADDSDSMDSDGDFWKNLGDLIEPGGSTTGGSVDEIGHNADSLNPGWGFVGARNLGENTKSANPGHEENRLADPRREKGRDLFITGNTSSPEKLDHLAESGQEDGCTDAMRDFDADCSWLQDVDFTVKSVLQHRNNDLERSRTPPRCSDQQSPVNPGRDGQVQVTQTQLTRGESRKFHFPEFDFIEEQTRQKEKQEREQEKMWEGIDLPPGLEDLKKYVHLV